MTIVTPTAEVTSASPDTSAGAPLRGGLGDRWRGLSPLSRGLLIFGLFVIALNLTSVMGQFTGGNPSGRSSSSYATAPDGLAAYFELLRRDGHPAQHERSSPSEGTLNPSTTLFVIEPFEILPDDAAAIRRFVESGGRLVATEADVPWLSKLLDNPPELSGEGRERARMLTDIYPGVQRLRFDGTRAWGRVGDSTAIVGEDGQVLVTTATLGSGEMVFLADASVVENRRLAEADNAAFGLSIAGESARPVVFLESVHGYGNKRGLAALPTRWKTALWGLLIAMLTWLVARGRRLGPPEDAARNLPPPRQLYVKSLATSVAKTKEPRPAIDVLSHRAISTMTQRGLIDRGGDSAPDQDAIRRAATRAGLDEAEVSALFGNRSTDEDLLAAAHALATLTQERQPS